MRFSKLFVAIACVLLVLVGVALGYSIRMVREVRDIDRELKLLVADIEYLKYRLLILEMRQVTIEPRPEKDNI